MLRSLQPVNGKAAKPHEPPRVLIADNVGNELARRVNEHHGDRALAEWIGRAGFWGLWQFRPLRHFRTSAQTSEVEFRRVDGNALIVRLKAGGRDTGVEGQLLPPISVSAVRAAEALIVAAEPQRGHRDEPAAIPPSLPPSPPNVDPEPVAPEPSVNGDAGDDPFAGANRLVAAVERARDVADRLKQLGKEYEAKRVRADELFRQAEAAEAEARSVRDEAQKLYRTIDPAALELLAESVATAGSQPQE